MVLVSNLSERREIRYLQVALVGSRSNRDGLGARVTLTAGPNRYTKVHDGQSGYLSHGLYPLYFGLGDAKSVDEVLVVWPSGREQVVRGAVDTNETLEIREEG